MGEDIYQVTFKNFIKWSLENNTLFENLRKEQIDQLIQKMKLTSYKINETIFRKGVMGFQKLVVVVEGQLKNAKNGTIVASKGQCFGCEFMLRENKTKTMEDEIVMNSYGVLAELTDYKTIEELYLDDSAKKKDRDTKPKNINISVKNRKAKLQNLNINQLFIVEQIKMGQFGPIFVVRDQTNQLAILRNLSKKMLEQYEVEEFIQN
jgi:signal-transduction protein with cAMP-binding, CBS, and nucleotidyltransferase domain